ncbi:MAG: hypothetical protein JWM20_301 [Patescibacteria group bacterium]|nr:hypothetical protein [Patescibacteria group bacterium]
MVKPFNNYCIPIILFRMSDTSQKPSWLATLLNKDTDSKPAAAPAPTAAPDPSPVPQPPSAQVSKSDSNTSTSTWASSITVGKGTLADDPMSGSIMKLLDGNGFRQKIESGMATGHTFTIIHNAPSTEFLMIEQWMENGEPRKNYQAFTIKSHESKPSVSAQEVLPPHPVLVTLRDLENELDELLTQTKRFA